MSNIWHLQQSSRTQLPTGVKKCNIERTTKHVHKTKERSCFKLGTIELCIRRLCQKLKDCPEHPPESIGLILNTS